VVASEMDIDAVLSAFKSTPVDVAILNLDQPRDSFPDMSIVRRLHIAHCEIPKILLLDSCDRDVVVSAFRSGARGIFCFSDYPFRMLCKCIRCVHRGQIWASSEQVQQVIQEITHVPSLRTVNSKGMKLLTPREEQVVALVADGLSNRETARELSLSENTIKKYLFRIFDKLGISSRVELVLFAVSHGGHREAEWVAGQQQ
jgi:DNA-binding NarL/FixJ family response regulator